MGHSPLGRKWANRLGVNIPKCRSPWASSGQAIDNVAGGGLVTAGQVGGEEIEPDVLAGRMTLKGRARGGATGGWAEWVMDSTPFVGSHCWFRVTASVLTGITRAGESLFKLESAGRHTAGWQRG